MCENSKKNSKHLGRYELYVSKLHPGSPYLWQYPRGGRINYLDSCWYDSRRVGHNPTKGFIKELCKDAKLISHEYTNHSIRNTCISCLDDSGFEARHITALTSFKSENTIKEYSVCCPEHKKKVMFDALAQPLQKQKNQTQPNTKCY